MKTSECVAVAKIPWVRCFDIATFRCFVDDFSISHVQLLSLLSYARFFSIMKDPNTPYLFACGMFLHVSGMRERGIKIMSKSYGAVHRSTLKNHVDKYPLAVLRDVFCFESTDEARETCRHYNIAVVHHDSNKRCGEYVELRKRERTDHEEGHIIPLWPLKIQTIEMKRESASSQSFESYRSAFRRWRQSAGEKSRVGRDGGPAPSTVPAARSAAASLAQTSVGSTDAASLSSSKKKQSNKRCARDLGCTAGTAATSTSKRRKLESACSEIQASLDFTARLTDLFRAGTGDGNVGVGAAPSLGFAPVPSFFARGRKRTRCEDVGGPKKRRRIL